MIASKKHSNALSPDDKKEKDSAAGSDVEYAGKVLKIRKGVSPETSVADSGEGPKILKIRPNKSPDIPSYPSDGAGPPKITLKKNTSPD